MINCMIDTQKYDIDLEKLLSRRLSQCGCTCGIGVNGGVVSVSVSDGEQLKRLADALMLVLCRDLQYFELARMIDDLPLSLPEKQTALASALETAHESERTRPVRDALVDYLQTERYLNLEGFVQFRMQESLRFWRDCAERAATETLIRREYTELLGVLSAFVKLQAPRISELSICIHPDGSCTLTDDSDACIEYVDCSEDGIVSMLVGMAPARLTIYDLSGGSGRRLTDALRRVFAGRVKVYR